MLNHRDWNVQARGTSEAAIFSHYENAKRLAQGEITVPPRMISLWPSEACNLKCPHCFYDHCGRLMDVENFKTFADEAREAGVEALEFSGGGEPTWNGRFYEMAHYAKYKGFALGLLTNGFWLDPDYLLTDFDYVRISMDAGSEKTYQIVKQPKSADAFAMLCQQVRLLTAEKERRKSRTRIILKFLLTQDNAHEIVEFAYWGVKLNADAIHYKPAHGRDCALTQEQRQSAETEIEYVREQIFENALGSAHYEVPYKERCFMSPIHAVLRTNGDLTVCCYFDDLIIGNVFENSFPEVWATRHHHDVMNQIDPKRCVKVDCRWHKYNALMADMRKLNVKFI